MSRILSFIVLGAMILALSVGGYAVAEEDYMTDSGEVRQVSDGEEMTDSGEIEEVSDDESMTDSGEVRDDWGD